MFSSIISAIAQLSGLLNTLLGGWFKKKEDERAVANRPDIIAAKEAQVQQDDHDRASDLTSRAMKGDKVALQELRNRNSE